jgi:hypothetical protein
MGRRKIIARQIAADKSRSLERRARQPHEPSKDDLRAEAEQACKDVPVVRVPSKPVRRHSPAFSGT